jgi:hypothetical protein
VIHLEIVVRRPAGRPAVRVQLGRDGVHDRLDLCGRKEASAAVPKKEEGWKRQRTSELLLEVLNTSSRAVLVDPVGGVLDSREDRLLILVADLATETLLVAELRLEPVDERRQRVERLDALPLRLVLGRELLGLGHHAVDLLLGQTALLVGDGDALGLAAVQKKKEEKDVNSN